MDYHQDNYLQFGPYPELMAGIRTALDINQGIIKVVGQNGTGKTSLCRQLEAILKAEGHDVIFFESPPESSDFLYQRIQSELGLDRKKNFDRMLNRYLLARQPPNNRLVIIYDDAEKIPRDIFILIRLLNNVHGESETLVSQIICGTSRLDRIFDDPELRSLTQYLNQSFVIEPMTREALEDFHAGYRKVHGISAKPLDNKSLTDIYIKGQGMPGKTLELIEQAYKPPAPASPPAPPAVPAKHAENAAGRKTRSAADQPAVDAGMAEKAKASATRDEPGSGKPPEAATGQSPMETAGKMPQASAGKSPAETPQSPPAVSVRQAPPAPDPVPVDKDKAGSEDKGLAPPAGKTPGHDAPAVAASADDTPVDVAAAQAPAAAVEADGGNDLGVPDPWPAAAIEATPTPDPQAPLLEIDSILRKEQAPPENTAGMTFKVVVALLVVVVSMILSYVLSGNSDIAVDRIAQIMADDSPLYLDEVASVPPPREPADVETAVDPEVVASESPSPLGPAAQTLPQQPLSPSGTDNDDEEATTTTVNAVAPASREPAGPAAAAEVDGPSVVAEDIAPLPATPGPSDTPAVADDATSGSATAPAAEGPGNQAPVTADTFRAPIQAWADAWENGNFAGYLAAYHDAFMADADGARSDWETQRRSRIDQVAGISTDFDRLELVDAGADEATVRFWLYYSRGNYADETHKELVFKRDGEDWLILSESNLDVITR